MLVPDPLFQIFGGARARVLQVLLEVEGPLTTRAIARIARVSPTTASTGLRNLKRAGLVTARPSGSSISYVLNGAHYAAPFLQAIHRKSGQADRAVVRRIVQGLPDRPLALVLFGSIARGAAGPTSDVDILVIVDGARSERRALDVRFDLERRLSLRVGRRVSLLITVRPKRADLERPFWREVARDGRTLHGTPLSSLVRWPVQEHRGERGSREASPAGTRTRQARSSGAASRRAS